MNLIRLCLILFPFFISCSSAESESDTQSKATQRLVDLEYDVEARNSANPYDDVGQVHNELLLTYYYAESQPLSFNGKVSTLTGMASSNTSFYAMNKQFTYAFSSTAENRVLAILTEQDSCLVQVIDSSVVGQVARDSLENFVRAFLDMCATEEDYGVLYDYVIAYEDSVVKSTWMAEDKRVILITTSVARHAAYVRKKKPKKNKDPDWEYMVGNIIATIDGARVGETEAVMRGLVAGVTEN